MNQIILQPKTKVRESSFELLRIIAMFMVLVLHADFVALGAPTRADIMSSPISSTIKVFFEVASIVAVNVFILIAGWFGIRPSVRGFCKFIFQCLFFSIGAYALMILCGRVDFSFRGLANCFALIPNNTYWFIPSYLCLYLFSPVLNTFIKNADKSTFALVLLAFYIFQTIYSFLGHGALFLMRGYSGLSFVGLYLLAAYVKENIDKIRLSSFELLIGYFAVTICLCLTWIGSRYLNFNFINTRLLYYSNPLVILSSLFLFLFFSRIHIDSSFINRIAASSFAVYLLHCNPNIYEFYLTSICSSHIYSGLLQAIYICCLICIWFLVPVILDVFRLLLWNFLQNFSRG